MPTFSVKCSKCNTTHDSDVDYDSVFAYMAIMRVQGWQIPDALENLPILCPTCRKNQP
jgi:hypothetical protein